MLDEASLDEAISDEASSDETISDEEQAAAQKKPEAARAFVESTIETDGIDRTMSQLKRFRASEVKAMIRDEYPETGLDSEAVMNLTKKELLDWLNDFYRE